MRRLLLLAILLLTPATAMSGAWMRDAGRFYLNLNYGFIRGEKFYGADFGRVPIGRYSQHTVGLYSELGIIDRWLTVSVDATLYRNNMLSGQTGNQGVGDFTMGFWTGLLTSPFRLSAGMLLGIPLGNDRGIDAESPDPARPVALPTGDGEVDVQWRLALGYSFGGKRYWPLKHYLAAEVGYWLRTRGFADAFTYKLEFGINFPWTFIDRFWFIGRFFGVEAFASEGETSQNVTGLGSGATYNAYGFEVYVRLWQGLGLSFAREGAFRARSVVAAPQYRFTLSYEY